MEKRKLTEICNPKQWKTIPISELVEVGYPVYGANGIIGFYNEYNHEEKTIAITCRGATCGTVNLTCPKAYITGNAMCLDDVNNTVILEYLFYAMKAYDFSKVISGSAQPQITRQGIEKVEVVVYPPKKQQQIVCELQKVESLIALREEQLAKLDELVKARFVELFVGKGYPTKTVDEVSLGKGEYGAQSASSAYDPTRPRYVRITDINDDGTLNDDVVSSANFDDDEQYKLEYGDFMFARMGATVGKTYAFIEGNQIFAGYLIRYRLNKGLINPHYLFWYTKLDEYWNWVKLNQSGAAQPGINAKKYGSLQIPLPPIEEQNAFAAFVEQTDKSKLAIQESLAELETLKKALMQKYFG